MVCLAIFKPLYYIEALIINNRLSTVFGLLIRAMSTCPRKNTYIANEIKLFTLLSRYILTRQCEVSLPQKTSLICQAKRILGRLTMKKRWKLTKSPFGFMVLDRTPIEHVLETFLDPFTRFNMEEYLQTVFTSDITYAAYNVLVKNASEIRKKYNYRILSKYFAMASKLGGVSIIFSSRRLW